MKKSTKRAIDSTIDDYYDDIVKETTKAAINAHILGDLLAFRYLKIPIAEFKVQQEALEFGKGYRKLMREKGASIIQGKPIPWLEEHTKRTRDQVYQIIEQGIKEGKPVADIGGKRGVPGTIAHDLKQLGIREKDYEYVRIARSEVGRIQNQGSLNRFLKNNITHVAVSDGDEFDDACRAANGQVWTVEYAQAHELEHPNCTRAFRPIVPDDWVPVE